MPRQVSHPQPYTNLQPLKLGAGLYFSFWTISWSLIWIPLATWFLPRLRPRHRPNIIALVVECASTLWWLITFATLAMIATAQDATTAFLRDYDYDYGYGDAYAPTDIDEYVPGRSAAGAIACTKAATALAAFNWALFTASFVAICVRIRRQRRERTAENQVAQGAGAAAPATGPATVVGTDSDKMAQSAAHAV
ncbi:tyrosine/serine/threonine protein phosphatase pps1 [Exophiala xenobiotica]|uniref:Tyrosine/serine/threonine protein phosphatase pps1 n=1 Tax=Lithohypha guttulata TaxID=1690604 RepID=A0ABR0K9B1_9EURO|nr:tyrosine/serine/threonine protein phosphatase pps1 [Lithohypha guttulata]KAK5316643.1 tyrosine/serine/threonine protein phosphatase pps1 [Exophiala xenobiotica]